MFFDPNLLSTDGTTSLAFREFSPSAKYVAYGVSKDGGDRITIYVRKTDCPHPKSADQGGIRGQDPGRLPDEVRFVQFNIASWLPDESGACINLFDLLPIQSIEIPLLEDPDSFGR